MWPSIAAYQLSRSDLWRCEQNIKCNREHRNNCCNAMRSHSRWPVRVNYGRSTPFNSAAALPSKAAAIAATAKIPVVCHELPRARAAVARSECSKADKRRARTHYGLCDDQRKHLASCEQIGVGALSIPFELDNL